ncbi:hypothetical protein [Bacteriovorax sp. Seq25_V]|uniref:hypothetical protein n=1 Tax=Bacteriovorax sp. Seq25_V TaxID=1201288 RepID=UPI000389E0EB|nr:hypothetical protein [Bacteriovorax sp. Seq25_V]EQC43792.1 hypothetical protein M900_1327 [Bacteriovorax sp. Seq25_V]
MKLSLLLLSTISTLNTYAAPLAKKELLFECPHKKTSSPVDRLFIYKKTLGSKETYEVEVQAYQNGIDKTYSKKVNLISKYDGRILEFTTGNFRVKIDKVRENEDKFWAFARIPEYDIHSFDWSCKEQ